MSKTRNSATANRLSVKRFTWPRPLPLWGNFTISCRWQHSIKISNSVSISISVFGNI